MTKIDSKYIFQERIKGLLIIAENLVLEHERKGENVAVFKKAFDEQFEEIKQLSNGFV